MHYISPKNTAILRKRGIDLFPKRRQSDMRKPFSSSYLTTFTDLIALLLTFFIIIYATRDPAPIRLIVIDPPAIAAPVKPTPPNISDVPSLKQTKTGLELNYIAGLLNQAATRETALAKAQITSYPFALTISMPASALDTANIVLDRVQSSDRDILIYASQAVINSLWVRGTSSASEIIFMPRDSDMIDILIH